MLDWLIQESCKKEPEYHRENPFVVYSLNKLVYELRRHADLNDPRLKFTSTQLVAEKLCSGDFTHRSNMACQVMFYIKFLDFSVFFTFTISRNQWHDDEDKGVHCSLTIARNYAFIISDLCCENYGIALLPNRHCPAEVIDETKYEVLPKMPRHDVSEVIIFFVQIHQRSVVLTNSIFYYLVAECEICQYYQYFIPRIDY